MLSKNLLKREGFSRLQCAANAETSKDSSHPYPAGYLPIKSPLLIASLLLSLQSLQTMLQIKANRRNITNNISTSLCAVQSGVLEHISLQGRGRSINLKLTDFRRFNYTKFDDSTRTENLWGEIKPDSSEHYRPPPQSDSQHETSPQGELASTDKSNEKLLVIFHTRSHV